MEIVFVNSRLEKICNSAKKMKAEYGEETAKVLARRLVDLRAVATLEELDKLLGRCHPLSGPRAGQYALDLRGPKRLIFIPHDNPLPQLPSGGLNRSLVTSVCILEINIDYH